MEFTIASVVEGHGEVDAVPALLRNILYRRGLYEVRVLQPHRISRTDMVGGKVSAAVRMQMHAVGDRGLVVVVCDSDDEDYQTLEERIHKATGSTDHRVVVSVAVREFESWILAGIGSLRGMSIVRDELLAPPANPESKRNAKKVLGEYLTVSYKETIHQATLASKIDVGEAMQRSPSLERFVTRLSQAVDALFDIG